MVRFVARDVAACEASTLEGLGWLLLDWELGEERAMDEVADVVMVDALEDELPVAELGSTLRRLARAVD